MRHFILKLAVIGIYVCFVEGESSCVAPNGIPGTCKPLHQCKSLLNLVHKNFITDSEMEFLNTTQCLSQHTTPTVCCPPYLGTSSNTDRGVCTTPDGNMGKCVDIYKCRHISQLLIPPISLDRLTFIKNSKCNGKAQYSVCCGSYNDNICKMTVSAYPPDPSTECCGVVSTDDNIGGTATRANQYPWLALIEYQKDGAKKHLCSGALISGRYLLTAAHCVAGDIVKYATPRKVILSENFLTKERVDCAAAKAVGGNCTDTVLRIPIESIIPHPEYNSNKTVQRNDIALIRLWNWAPYTEHIRPICLPQTDITLNPPVDFKMVSAGWYNDKNNEPNDISLAVRSKANLPYVKPKDCKMAYGKPGGIQLSNKQMCAGGKADSCVGGAGSPLAYENERVFEAIGVFNFGPVPCGNRNTPEVFTKVIDYKDWILSNIKP